MCRMGFITGGPNEAIVVSGCLHARPLIVVGGWAFVIPCVQRVQRLSLNVMTLKVSSPKVYTMQGVPLSVTGIAQVKFTSTNDEMLRAAIEQFIDKSAREIEEIATLTLEGHQRAIMGAMTVDEIFKDRKKFSRKVFDIASTDLLTMGMQVISYTLKDVKDEEEYMTSLGMARTAEVQRDARMGEAEAQRDAAIRTAMAEEERIAAKLENDADVERFKRDFSTKKAVYDAEVEANRADAELAFKLQECKVRQRIAEESRTVEVIERMKLIEVAEQETARKLAELEAKVRQPAEAEKSRIETLSKANNTRVVMEAEGEAAAAELRGQAEAEAMELKARSEADAMRSRAEAFEHYRKAAKLAMVLESLPRIAAEVAAPLSQTQTLTMVLEADSKRIDADNNNGPARLTQEVLNIVEQMPQAVQDVTGRNIKLAAV